MSSLDQIVRRFQGVDRDTRLELLLDYARKLPALPERYVAARDQGINRVPECQSPVFLFFELDGDRVELHADAPREAPTVRGFVSILVKALNGGALTEAAAVPLDLIDRLGLSDVLGMMRTQGLSAVTARIRRLAQAHQAEGGGK